MPDWPFGGEPQDGSPDWFTYTEADVGIALPPVAGWVALTALGIPSGPQNTADFCRVLPSEEFSTTADIGVLGFPPLAIASGAYGRLGNRIKASKWAGLCQLSQGPNNGLSGTPNLGYDIYYLNESVTWVPDSGHVLAWGGDQLPITGVSVGLRVVSYTGNIDNLWWMILKSETHAGDARPFTGDARLGYPITANGVAIGTWQYQEFDSTHGLPPLWPSFVSFEAISTPVTLVFSIAWKPAAITAPVAPDPLADIPGYPTGSGPCDAPTLADLCKSLRDLHDKVDVLSRNAGPPPGPFEGPPVTPDPVLPAPTDPAAPVPLHPVVKPPTAVGAVVKVTAIPDWAARYGTGPTFYPNIGHVAFVTEAGPLPSQLLKHAPMVIEPLPMFVTAVQLDLEPGVTATVSWLYPPTDPPKPAV